MPKIFFTGGGTAGHVTPNIAVIRELTLDFEIGYVGESSSVEEKLISSISVPFFKIKSGKLRRYFSLKNFYDPFKVIVGFFQSLRLCVIEKPDLVFSKGGYVAVPLVLAARVLNIPIIAHESDLTPGLANRLTFPFCSKICLTFPPTVGQLSDKRVVLTGTPLRRALLEADAKKGASLLKFDINLPILLVFGGSKGARFLNELMFRLQDKLLESFNVVHITGEGNRSREKEKKGYIQKEFLHHDFGDILAAASVVVSRAGANSIYELLALRKPHLLVPLPKTSSRGDQLENAKKFCELGYSRFIEEDLLADDIFIQELKNLMENKTSIEKHMANFKTPDAVSIIIKEIKKITGQTTF